MENPKETTQEQGPVQSSPPYISAGFPRKEFFRDDARYKSPALATLMSMMPGLGQIYIGYYQQGFINIVIIATIISILASMHGDSPIVPFLGLFLAFYWLYNMVDAARKATFYNQAVAGMGPLPVPEGEQLLGTKGSLVGGIVMIVIGGIALAHTRFGMPLEWVERWWPLVLVLMGAWLLFQSVANKAKK